MLLFRRIGSCDTKEELKKPGWAKTTEGDWVTVINTHEYPQEVRTSVCKNLDLTCSLSYSRKKTTCQQKYAERRWKLFPFSWEFSFLLFLLKNECFSRLMVVDLEDPERGIFTAFFSIPSSCTCAVVDSSEDSPFLTESTSSPDRGWYSDRKSLY